MSDPGTTGDCLATWPGVEVGSPLSGGVRAVVRAARRGDERLVVTVSPRSGSSPGRDLDLLRILWEHGLSVPETVLTADGRDRDGSVVVHRFLLGGPLTGRGSQEAAAEVVEPACAARRLRELQEPAPRAERFQGQPMPA